MSKLSYKTLLIIFFSLLIGIVILWKFVLPNHKVEASWWNDGWNYRKAVSISNTSGSNLTDFQISLSIGTSALIASGKMQSDCDDIRITDINGNLLPYWIEHNGNLACNKDTTRIWVKANSLPTSGATIYIYYGNTSATSTQDGYKVFEWFEDFEDANKVASIYDKTSNVAFNYTISNSLIHIDGNYHHYHGLISKNDAGLNANDYIVEYYSPYVNSDAAKIALWGQGSQISGSWMVNDTYPFLALMHISGAAGTYTWTPATIAYSYIGYTGVTTSYVKYQFHRDDTTGANGYIKYLELRATPDSATNFADSRQITAKKEAGNTQYYGNKILILGENNELDFDWVRVRKYTSVEPTYALQSEEVGGGPIAYWKFDEGTGTTTYDSTTNQNNGTLGTGSSAPTWADESQCISGKCLKFSGGSVDITGSNKLNTNSFTFSTWVKLNAYNPDSNISSTVMTNYGGLKGTFLYIYNNGKLSVRTHDGATTSIDIKSNEIIQLNKWYFVSLTFDGTNLILYSNGKQVWSGSTTIVNNISNHYYIGGWSSNYLLNGLIDEPKIYPYARTAAQIKKDYNSRGSSKGTSANLGGAGSDNNLSDGLVGYWKMDEGVGTTTVDSSGKSNIATLSGSTLPSWSSGKYGIGLSFNGINSYLGVGNSVIPSGDFSISSWFYATDNTSYKTIVGQYASGQTGRLWFGFESSNFGYRIGSANQTISVDTNKWVFTTITRQNNQVKIYINGELKNTSTASDNIYQTNTYIGSYDSTGGFFAGTLDEVRIYNRALSSSEVTQLYEFAPEPVGYWDFEENTGTTIKDKSGNGNTGTLYNSPTWTQGKIGSAIDLNGTNQYADITTSSSAIQGYGTFEIWFKPNNCSAANQSIFSQRYTSWHGRGIIISSNTISGWSRNGSATWQSVTLGSCVNNQWYHAVLTQEGNIIKGYLNGVFISSLDMTSSLDGSYLNYYTIGKYTNDSYFFDGTVDNVKIYNYARTQKQIIEDMNAGTPASSNKSPIAYWKFDEGSGTTTNNSGNGGSTFNTIFATGSSAPTWTNDGKSGKALNFDGVSNYALANSDPAYNLQEMTISAWVKPDSVDKTGPIVGNVFGWWYRYGIFISGGTYTALFRSTGGTWTLSSSVSSSPNNWDYVAVSYKDGTAKIYVNGKLRNSGTFTYAPLTQSSSTIMFGTHSISANDWFKGSLDEVKIYNYALTDEEIKQDYNAGSALQMGQTSQTIGGTTTSLNYCIPGDTSYCAAPVAEYNFEENTGLTAKDTSGNNNNGTISGATWTTGANNKGAGLKFSGSGYINSGVTQGYTGNLNINFWIKTNSSTTGTIVSKYGNNSYWTYRIYTDTNGKINFERGNNTAAWVTTLISNKSVNDNKWHFVSANYDSTKMSIYIDGQLDNSVAETRAADGTNYYNFCIGNDHHYCTPSGPKGFFNGSIDGVKIYNYARTPAQVAYDYNKGGPIGWWKFDECQGGTAYDSSGVGNTGVIVIGSSGTQNSLGTCQIGTSAAWTNGASGHTNSSLNFDGNDDAILLGKQTGLNGVFTASAWFKRKGSAGGGYHGIINSITGDAAYTRILIESAGASIVLQQRDSTSSVITGTWNNQPFGDNNWHHIVYVFDGSFIKLYTDGKLQGSPYACNGVISSSGILEIGRGQSNSYFSNGQIDDVRIYNYALTSEQVKTIYNNGAVNFQ